MSEKNKSQLVKVFDSLTERLAYTLTHSMTHKPTCRPLGVFACAAENKLLSLKCQVGDCTWTIISTSFQGNQDAQGLFPLKGNWKGKFRIQETTQLPEVSG